MPVYYSKQEELVTLIDESGANTYVGVSSVGNLESAAVWQIKRVNESGSLTTVKFADGSSDFDKVWADRATYTY